MMTVTKFSQERCLIQFQKQNQQQILDYRLTLIVEAVLVSNPIQPVEIFLQSIVNADAQSNKDPPLQNHWDVFQTE